MQEADSAMMEPRGRPVFCHLVKAVEVSQGCRMTERRILLGLLLLAAAAALYIWGRGNGTPETENPVKAEAAERANAEPFPEPAPSGTAGK